MHRICGRSSSGRAPPCQGGGSEFEPRRPLQYEAIVDAEMQKRWLFCFVWQWPGMLSACQSKEPPYNTMHGGSSYNINMAPPHGYGTAARLWHRRTAMAPPHGVLHHHGDDQRAQRQGDDAEQGSQHHASGGKVLIVAELHRKY